MYKCVHLRPLRRRSIGHAGFIGCSNGLRHYTQTVGQPYQPFMCSPTQFRKVKRTLARQITHTAEIPIATFKTSRHIDDIFDATTAAMRTTAQKRTYGSHTLSAQRRTPLHRQMRPASPMASRKHTQVRYETCTLCILHGQSS